MSRRPTTTLFLSLMLLIAASSAAGVAAAPARPTDSAVSKQLAEVRQATARYHDVEAAIADGYVPTDHCLAVPGVGTMGYHYINPALAGDAEIDPTTPELLLYVPAENGVKLVAVEYFVAAAAVTETPWLFDQPFDGPMAGHEPGMPEHYDLHVWLWAHNPDGLFAQFNPSVGCGA